MSCRMNVVALDAEVELEGLRIGGGLGQLFGDEIMKPGRRAVRLSPGVAQGRRSAAKGQSLMPSAGEKVQAVSGFSVFEDRAENKSFERRHVGKRDVGGSIDG